MRTRGRLSPNVLFTLLMSHVGLAIINAENPQFFHHILRYRVYFMVSIVWSSGLQSICIQQTRISPNGLCIEGKNPDTILYIIYNIHTAKCIIIEVASHILIEFCGKKCFWK